MISFLASPSFRVFALLAMIVSSWVAGFLAGTRSGRVEQLEATVEAIARRGKIDAKMSSCDARCLCLGLGGLPDQCDKLRGLDQTTPAK